MKSFAAGLLGIALTLVTNTSADAESVQWKIEDGGNGHWYESVCEQNGVSWTAASNAAIAQGGFLATVHSDAENDFVYGLVVEDKFWFSDAFGNGIGPAPCSIDSPIDAISWRPAARAIGSKMHGTDRPRRKPRGNRRRPKHLSRNNRPAIYITLNTYITPELKLN